MSVEQRVEDGGVAHRFVITDEDGDTLTAKAYPGGGLVITATRVSGRIDTVPVHIAPADRDALVAFLTGDARAEQPAEQPAEQSVEACARCGGPRDAHPGGACDEWVDEAGEDLT